MIKPRTITLCIALCASIQVQAQVDDLMSAVSKASAPSGGLSIVRESILRESAVVFGAREGLRKQSCLIALEIEKQRPDLDRRFRFGDLMIGKAVLPPAISEARNSVSLEDTVMRVANFVYRLDENARVVDIPPTWRDWLFVGLAAKNCDGGPVDTPTQDQQKPQTPQEVDFYRAVLDRSYSMGAQQAKDVFVANLARLERTYLGMRRYFDLYARGIVSAPVVASSTDVVVRDDPNTLVVGNTVIRITVPVDFIEKSDNWKPLGE